MLYYMSRESPPPDPSIIPDSTTMICTAHPAEPWLVGFGERGRYPRPGSDGSTVPIKRSLHYDTYQNSHLNVENLLRDHLWKTQIACRHSRDHHIVYTARSPHAAEVRASQTNNFFLHSDLHFPYLIPFVILRGSSCAVFSCASFRHRPSRCPDQLRTVIVSRIQ